jgi:ribosomal-protein-alanine N-acetyltransferase
MCFQFNGMDRTVFTQFPVLRSDRLLLAKVTEKDLNEFAEMLKHRESRKSNDPADVLRQLYVDYDQEKLICWGLFLDGELIGTCGYYRGFKNQIGEVGYVMRRSYRGKGYMREALQCVLGFAKHRLGLEMVTAFTGEDNLPSQNLLLRLGFDRTDQLDGGDRKFVLSLAE